MKEKIRKNQCGREESNLLVFFGKDCEGTKNRENMCLFFGGCFFFRQFQWDSVQILSQRCRLYPGTVVFFCEGKKVFK